MSGFVNSNGVRIHYLAKNLEERKPLTLLFVPGVMMPAWIWEKQLAYFSKNYTVVAIDPRSQGESDQVAEGHYAYGRAQDIHSVVEALHLQPLVLIGWSIAVGEVINYAVHFGKALKGLVLVDGLSGIDPSVPFYEWTVDYWTQFQVNREKSTREFMKLILTQPQPETYTEKLYEVAMKTPTNTLMTLIENYILQDYRPLWPQLKLPVWIAAIEGQRLEYMQQMQRAIPQAQLTVFKEAGHALFVDQPEQFNHALEGFIQQL